MDAARKHVRRFQQLASQNLGRAEKTEVVTDDLHNVEQRVEHMIDALLHTKQKLTECLRSRSKEDNPEKRKKKLVEYHFAQSLLNDSKNLEDILKDSLLSQILSIYGNGLLNVVEHLVQSEFDVEKTIFERLSRYSEEEKSVAAQKDKMKKAILDMDSAKSRLTNATNKGEKSDHLQEETDMCWNKVESCKDNWALELYTLAGKEIDMANIFSLLVQHQMDYYYSAYTTLDKLLPKIKMKIDQYPRRPVYGCPLADHLRYSNREIAVVLEVCCAALCELGLREEGLFRISGTSPKIRKLKASFDIDEIDLNDFENHPHSIAGALKSYLREMPDPLMTHNLYGDWIRVAGIEDTETRLRAIKEVVAKLPSANHANLRYLIKFLSKLCENQQYTKMNSQSLAIVLAPNMLWSPNKDEGFGSNSQLATLVDCLISNADYFFPGEIKFTSSRIGSLINKTGGFIDSDSSFVQQRVGQPTDSVRSRSPTPSVDTLSSVQWNTSKTGPGQQPVRRPKPPAPPPPTRYHPPHPSAHLNVSVLDSSNEIEDPEYAVVPDDDDGDDEDSVDPKDPLYSVPTKLHHSTSAQTPPDDPVVVLESMSTSLIRTPPLATTDDAPKKHRKTNSLDRPARPPRISMMEGVTGGSTNSLERPLNPCASSKTPPNFDNHHQHHQATVVSSDEEKRQPSRPLLPNKDNVDKHQHPTVTSRHSINLKFVEAPTRPSPPPSLPVINSTHHGATNVEVEPPDDADDADMEYADGGGGGRGDQDNGPRQAPIVAFRRNMFEKNNDSYQQNVNGDVSSSSRSSTKKKIPSVHEERSPTSMNGAPPRPKPPVPSKPRTSAEVMVDDNMTRL